MSAGSNAVGAGITACISRRVYTAVPGMVLTGPGPSARAGGGGGT